MFLSSCCSELDQYVPAAHDLEERGHFGSSLSMSCLWEFCFSDHTSTQTYTHKQRKHHVFNHEQISAAYLQIYKLNKPSVLSGFCRTRKKESFWGTAGLKLLFNENSQPHLQWPSWQASHRLQSGQGFALKTVCWNISLCSKSVYNLEKMELAHLM